MDSGALTYFAYGSNMLSKRLQAKSRCPSASPIGAATLRGYALRWHKRSRKDGSGKCDIVRVEVPEAVVHGVLYEIDVSEKAALDREEGAGKGYAETAVVVLLDGVERRVTTYLATDLDHSLRPYSWYRALVVAGAREHRLPEDYIALLEAVATQEDPNLTRHAMNMRLIDGGCA